MAVSAVAGAENGGSRGSRIADEREVRDFLLKAKTYNEQVAVAPREWEA